MDIVKKLRRFLPLTFRQLDAESVQCVDELFDLPGGYFPTNPGCVDVPEGRLISARGANYTIVNPRTMEFSFASDGGYHSLSRIVLVTEKGVRRLDGFNGLLDGAEDVRLFTHGGSPWCLFTRPNASGDETTMILARLDLASETAEYFELRSPFDFRLEKNWSPFTLAGELLFVYSFDPLTILRFNSLSGAVEPHPNGVVMPDKSAFRFLVGGSTPGLNDEDGFIFIVHRRSIRLIGLRRVYLHRLARLSVDLRTLTWGPYFSIGSAEIQYVAGFSKSGNDVTLSYGRLDHHAMLAKISATELLKVMPRAGGR